MELIYWYAIGALLVALMSTIDLYHPVVSKREMDGVSRFLFYITFFLIAILVAPTLTYPCLNKFKGLEFRDAIDKALFE